MQGLILNVLRSRSLGDCTNGGKTSTADSIVVVHPELAGPFEPTPERPHFKVVFRENYGPYLAPVDVPPGTVGPMFGGHFAYTSDSRWSRFLAAKGLPGVTALPVHDRFETPELYARLSV